MLSACVGKIIHSSAVVSYFYVIVLIDVKELGIVTALGVKEGMHIPITHVGLGFLEGFAFLRMSALMLCGWVGCVGSGSVYV